MANTPDATTPPNQGISTPPNGGVVDDVGSTMNTDSEDSGSSSSSQTPPASTTPTSAPTSAAPTPQQNAPNQNLDSTNPPQGKNPDLSKNPNGSVNPNAPVAPVGPPPAVKKASIFHDVAETLAGGPRYTYTTDAYGQLKQQKVPVSNAHLALAIAMEALSGGITGLAQKGPNAQAEAAAAGLKQGQEQSQQIQQQDQQQRQQASADFAHKMQTTETNMRMWSLARQVGRDDLEANQKLDAEYADQLAYIQKTAPGVLQGPISSKDFPKYNVTADNAIPYRTVARIDPATGEQAVDGRGIPQWDHLYYIADPKQKLTNLFTAQDIATGKEAGILPKNIDPDMLINNPISLGLYLNKKSQIAQYQVSKQAADTYFGNLDKILPKGDEKGGSFTRDTLNSLIEKHAKDANLDPKYVSALVEQESGGNPGAVSPTGATGLTQLTGPIAKQFGVTDRTDPDQNLKAGTQLYAQLLKQFKDPRLAYAAYYSGPGAIKDGQIVSTSAHTAADTTKQADHFAGILQNGAQFAKIPVTTTQAAQPGPNGEKPEAGTVQGQLNPDTRMSVQDWTAKVNPKLPQDLEAFHAAVLNTPNQHNYSLAIGHMFKDNPDAAGNVLSFLGGADAVNKSDTDFETSVEMRKVQEQEKKAKDLAANKEQEDEAVQQKKGDMINTLLQATVPPNILQMKDTDAVKSLQDSGVTIPPDALIEAKAVANYDAPLSVASNKRWFKDSKIDQGELLSIVRQLNPTYKAENYDAIRSVGLPNSPQRKTIESASQLANHLNTLQDLIKNQAPDKSSLPLLNKMMQAVGYQTGGTQLTDVQAMANIVTSELGKTLAGGFAPDREQIQNIIKTMNPANATQQMQSILGLYIAAMHGKIAPLDDEFNQQSGASNKHLPVPHSLTTLLQSHGYDTPWDTNGQQQQSNQNQAQNQIPGQRPNETPVYVQGKVVGFTMPGKTGMRPVPQTQ